MSWICGRCEKEVQHGTSIEHVCIPARVMTLNSGLGEMTSLKEIKARLERIEQGQGVLAERSDDAIGKLNELQQGGEREDRFDANHTELWAFVEAIKDELNTKLDCIQGALLLRQFKSHAAPPRRKGKRK